MTPYPLTAFVYFMASHWGGVITGPFSKGFIHMALVQDPSTEPSAFLGNIRVSFLYVDPVLGNTGTQKTGILEHTP